VPFELPGRSAERVSDKCPFWPIRQSVFCGRLIWDSTRITYAVELFTHSGQHSDILLAHWLGRGAGGQCQMERPQWSHRAGQ